MDEVELLRISPVLHQEFHALAFCAEKIRQIDFTNSFTSPPSPNGYGRRATPSLQFLTPILNLLKSGITKCNRLILTGNTLSGADVEDLGKTLFLFSRNR
jgi:hypothetical protein